MARLDPDARLGPDVAYSLLTEAPMDVTIQTLLSGEDSHLGKNVDMEQHVTQVFWFYGSTCLGKALVIYMVGKRHFWTGPLRGLSREERKRAAVLERLFAEDPKQDARGGRYV
jgi:hypothetical protein